MRTALLLLFSFFTFYLGAQNKDALPWSINRHIYFARYAEAKVTAEAALQDRANAPTSYGYAVALSELGRVRLVFAQYKAADSLLTKALLLFEEQHTTADSAYLKTCTWAAAACRELALFPRAEALLKRGLQASESCKNTPHEAFRGDLLLEYAKWDAEMSRFQQAELHYAQAIAVFEKSFSKKSPKVAAALTDWAIFQNGQANYKQAGELITRALKILEPISTSFPLEYVRCLKAQADLYDWGLPRYREAEILYEKARLFARKQLGDNHTELADILISIGSYYKYNTVYFHQADTLFRQALVINELHFGPDYPTCVGILQKISDWQNTLGYINWAADTRKEAYERCRHVYGDIHPETADLMLNFAEDLKNKGQNTDAQDMLNKADSIYNVFFHGLIHEAQRKVLMTRASMVGNSGNLNAADSMYHRALYIAKEIYGKNSYTWWYTISQISSNFELMDELEKADSLLNIKTTFIKSQFGEQSIEYANILLSHFYLLKNKKTPQSQQKAEVTLQDFFSIIETCIGKENCWYLYGMTPWCRLLIEQKRYPEAEKALKEMEELVLKVYGEKSNAMVGVLEQQINLLDETRPPLESVTISRKKLALQHELGGTVWQYVLSLTTLANTLHTLGYDDQAQPLLEEATAEGKKLGKTDKIYVFTMLIIANRYVDLGRYAQAKAYFEEAKTSIQSMGTPKDLQGFYNSFFFSYLQETNQYQEAEQNILQRIKNNGLEEDAADYSQYGLLLRKMNKFSEAEKWFRKAIDVEEKAGKASDTYLYYNILSKSIMDQDRYPEAKVVMEKALVLAKNKYGTEHPKYATQLQNYAALLDDLGRYADAQQLYETALGIVGRTLGKEHLDYARMLNNLSVNFMEQSHYEECLSMSIQVLKIAEKNLGRENPDYAFYRGNLAYTYLLLGEYKEADSLSQENLVFWKKRSQKSSQYADALLLQADLLRLNGQYEKSIELTKTGLEIKESIFGKSSYRTSHAITVLKKGYQRQKNYREAIRCEYESLLIDSLAMLGNYDLYATHLRNLGELYFLMGAPSTAEYFLLQSIEVYKNFLGNQTHLNIGQSWAKLAGVYEQLGQLTAAEAAARKGLTIFEANLGKNNSDYIKLSRALAGILLANKKSDEALVHLQENSQLTFEFFKNKLGYLSSGEQTTLLAEYSQDFYPNAAQQYHLPELAGMCYNNALFFKGMALRNSRTLRDLLQESSDTAQLKLYDRFLNAQKDIAAEYKLLPVQRKNLDSLQSTSNNLERELIARSADYRTYIKRFDVKWQAIQGKLQPGDAAIEFVRYNRKRVIDTDTFLYAALVLLPGKDAPVFVPLCAESELKTKLHGNQVGVIDRTDGWAASLYRPETSNRADRVTGTSLYDLIWQPLNPVLKGVHRVYFSPDGLFHQISFAALGYLNKSENKVFLRDSFQLVQVASTRQLLTEYSSSILGPEEEVLVVGDIQYNSLKAKTSIDSLKNKCSYALLKKDEFTEACKLYEQNKQKVVQLSGTDATEQNVMAALNRHKPFRAISLITHGLFLPSAKKCSNLEHLYSEANPMQRSCLVFAGFNAVDTIKTYADDCLLTAQDFAGLNLKGTEVVIIPACESGLGDVLSSEGVFGLQRAFQEAGARYLIIALWKLPDVKTSIFMQTFYNQWLKEKKSVPDAFREAQRIMREDRDADAGTWGGLILIE